MGRGICLHYLPLCTVSDEVAWQCFCSLILSLKSPSSTCMGALVPIAVKGNLLCIFLGEEPEPCLPAALLLLDCSCFVSGFLLPAFLKSNSESVFWNSGKVREAEEAYLLQTRNRRQKGSHRVLLHFIWILSVYS